MPLCINKVNINSSATLSHILSFWDGIRKKLPQKEAF